MGIELYNIRIQGDNMSDYSSEHLPLWLRIIGWIICGVIALGMLYFAICVIAFTISEFV